MSFISCGMVAPAGKSSEARSVVLGEQVPLVRGKLAGDDPRRHVDVVRAGAAGKPIELIRNVIGILSSQ